MLSHKSFSLVLGLLSLLLLLFMVLTQQRAGNCDSYHNRTANLRPDYIQNYTCVCTPCAAPHSCPSCAEPEPCPACAAPEPCAPCPEAKETIVYVEKPVETGEAEAPWVPIEVDPCDVVFMIFSSKKNKDRHNYIHETWYKHLCPTDPNRNLVIASNANETNPLTTFDAGCGDGYDLSMCCKVIRGWEKAHELYPGKKWYIQGDDDSYFHIKALMKYLGLHDHNKLLHAGYLISQLYSAKGIPDPDSTQWLTYTVGWNTEISGASFDMVFERGMNLMFNTICKPFFYPDVTIGIILRAVGSQPVEEHDGYRMGQHEGKYPWWLPDAKEYTVAMHAFHNSSLLLKYEEFFYSDAKTWEDVGVTANI